VATHTNPIRVYLESGRIWDVAITHDEREKLDNLMWLKRCGAMLYKGDGVSVWFNGTPAPLSAVACYQYEVREPEAS
jgi:hypothetical protein